MLKFKDSAVITNESDILLKEKELNKVITNFKKIYTHSKEFSQLGFTLGINGGIKGTLDEIYKAAKQIPNIINSQQTAYFKNVIIGKTNPIFDIIELLKSFKYIETLDDSIKDSISTKLNDYSLKLDDISSGNAEVKLKESLKSYIIGLVSKDKKYLTDEYIQKTMLDALEYDFI